MATNSVKTSNFILREAVGGDVRLYSLATWKNIDTRSGATYELLKARGLETANVRRTAAEGTDLLIYLENGKLLVLENFYIQSNNELIPRAEFLNINLPDPTLNDKDDGSDRFAVSPNLTWGLLGLGGLLSLNALGSGDGTAGSTNVSVSMGSANPSDSVTPTAETGTLLQRALSIFEDAAQEISDKDASAAQKVTILTDVQAALDDFVTFVTDHPNATDDENEAALDNFRLAVAVALADLAILEPRTDNDSGASTRPLSEALTIFGNTTDEFSASGVSPDYKTPILADLEADFDTFISFLADNPDATDTEINAALDTFRVENARALGQLAALTPAASSDSSIVINNNLNGTSTTGTGTGTTPTITRVTTTEATGSTLVPGDVITIQLTANEAVTVGGASSTLRLALNNGEFATFSGGSGTTTLSFTYTVISGDFAQNLDVSSIDLGTGSLKNSAGQDFVIDSFTNLSASAEIDVQPAISAIDTLEADETFTAGDSIRFTVTFTDPIVVTDIDGNQLGLNDIPAEGTNLFLILDNGSIATYTSGSGTDTFTFTYELDEGDIATDIGPIAIAENQASLASLVASRAPLVQISDTLQTGFINDHELVIDADRPRIIGVVNNETSRSTAADAEENGDQFFAAEGTLTVTFDQDIVLTEATDDNIFLNLQGLFTGNDDNGDGASFNDAAVASLVLEQPAGATDRFTREPTRTLTFSYSGFLRDLGSMDLPDDFEISTAGAVLANTTIVDTSGNDAILTIDETNNIAAGAGRFIHDIFNIDVTLNDEVLLSADTEALHSLDLRALVGDETSGNVLVALSDANGDGLDYIDEHTNTAVSLARDDAPTQQLRALFSVEDIQLGRANIVSTLSELAVKMNEQYGIDLSDPRAIETNAYVADFFGLESLNIEDVSFTTDPNFEEASEAVQKYGIALATLSSLDFITGSIEESLELIIPLIAGADPNTYDAPGVYDLLEQAREAAAQNTNYPPRVQAGVVDTLNQMSETLDASVEAYAHDSGNKSDFNDILGTNDELDDLELIIDGNTLHFDAEKETTVGFVTPLTITSTIEHVDSDEGFFG